MPDTLGNLMFELSARIRKYRNSEMAKIVEAAGLTERDLAIMEFVNDKGKATFSEILEDLKMSNLPKASASAVSQAISSMYVEDGLVEKRPNPRDQRQPLISLTDKGKTVVEKNQEVRRKYMMMIRESMELTQEDYEVMIRAFKRGIENFDIMLASPQPSA